MHDLWSVGHPARWLIARGPVQILDGVIRNHPRSGSLRHRHPGCGLGCLRQCAPATRTVSKTWTRWLPAALKAIPASPPITLLFPTHFLPLPKPPARPARAPAGVARHLLARARRQIAGIVPCYLKSHSQGEYVFDRGWADAYERAGGRYYPKLQVSVPFTPATGPRLLIRDGVDREQIGTALASGLMALCNADQRLLRACDLRPRGGSEAARRARLPAAQRPAVSLAQ